MRASVVHLGRLGAQHRHPRHSIAPLRAGYAASVLRRHGWDVELIDTAVPGTSDEQLIAHLRRRRADVVVLEPRMENVREVAALAARLAGEVGATIAVGPSAEALAPELLRRGGPLAGVLGGEYEGQIAAVLEALARGGDGEGIAGWARPGPLGVRPGPAVAPIADLDALPMPPHDQFVAAGYRIGYPIQRRGAVRPAYVLSTRGCPYACTFCSPVEMRSRFLEYRPRDVTAVVEELAWVRRLGANTVYFIDDNFLRLPDRVGALCEEMLRRDLGLRWLIDCRVDDVDPRLLPLMRRAGCSTFCVGAESGSQRVLDSLRKGLNVETTWRACRAIHDAGMWIVMYVILGAPGESAEEREATWEMVDALRPELVQCHRFARYPMARGERRDPAAWQPAGDKFVGIDGLGAPPIALDQRDFYRRYYLSPRFVADYIRTRGPYLPGPVLRDLGLTASTLSFLLHAP